MKGSDFLDVVDILSGDNALPQEVLLKFQGILSVLSRWTLPIACRSNDIFQSLVPEVSGC